MSMYLVKEDIYCLDSWEQLLKKAAIDSKSFYFYFEVGSCGHIGLDKNCRVVTDQEFAFPCHSWGFLNQGNQQFFLRTTWGLSKTSFWSASTWPPMPFTFYIYIIIIIIFSFDYFAGEKNENLCNGGDGFLLLVGFVIFSF